MRYPLASRIARAAVTPLMPADYLDVFAPLHGSTLRAKVVGVRRLTGDAAAIDLIPGRAWQGHRPGQYLRLGIDIDGVRHWRCYSITSRPRDKVLNIAVRAQGLVSRHLVRATPGQIVELDQASGDFSVEQPTKALFVTAGSGITPVIGMLRSLDFADVVVIHSERGDRSMFGAELRALASLGRIRLVERDTSVQGRLRAADLPDLVADIATRQAAVCGPAGLIDDVLGFYASQGWATPTYERFETPQLAAGQGGTVTFARSGVVTEATASLLETGEASGVLMPSGCRMGICYGCVIPLTEGSVRDLRDGTVTTADHEPVLIQTCINSAAGLCALDV